MRIWKWKLEATDVQTIEVPAGAKLLDVQAQGGLPQSVGAVRRERAFDSAPDCDLRHRQPDA